MAKKVIATLILLSFVSLPVSAQEDPTALLNDFYLRTVAYHPQTNQTCFAVASTENPQELLFAECMDSTRIDLDVHVNPFHTAFDLVQINANRDWGLDKTCFLVISSQTGDILESLGCLFSVRGIPKPEPAGRTGQTQTFTLEVPHSYIRKANCQIELGAETVAANCSGEFRLPEVLDLMDQAGENTGAKEFFGQLGRDLRNWWDSYQSQQEETQQMDAA